MIEIISFPTATGGGDSLNIWPYTEQEQTNIYLLPHVIVWLDKGFEIESYFL